MSIWILAILILAVSALAGWRAGAIQAAFSFVGIILGALLATLVGKLFHPILPHVGASNPLIAWALAPIFGFILVSILFKVAGFSVHRKVEVFYKYKAGDLRLSLWQRLNSRLGICLGLLNGAAYFVLISFVIFNLAYLTTQAGAASNQPLSIRVVNQMGNDLQSTGVAKTAAGVATLPPMYYKLADLSGFLMQNPQAGQRLADYPGIASLWEREDMQPLIQDPALTNALAAGTSVGQILKTPSVQDFLKNKEQTKLVLGIFQTNLADLTIYLETGKSPKFNGEKILGRWEFNPVVTLAWMRQSRPKMAASEMRAIRALWSQAYAQTSVLFTGDNQLFLKNYPRFSATAQAGQMPFQLENWKGDWSVEGTNYTLHLAFNSEEKFLSATADGLRLSVRDNKTFLVFDKGD